MAVHRQVMKPHKESTKSECEQRISMLRLQLIQYCEFLSGSRVDAEDLVQTTLLKALPVLQGERHHPNLPALLRRIAKNTWLDEVGKRRHYHLCEPEDLQNAASVGLEDNSTVRDTLQILMQTLTPQQQVVVLLCDVFQYTDREAAEFLGVSRGAIKASLHRARLRLETVRAGKEVSPVTEELQTEILTAYVAAFQSADVRALVQLCQNGVLDPVQATSKAFTFAQKARQNKANASTRTSMFMAA